MSEEYEDQQLKVLLAQAVRTSSNTEEDHTPNCTHPECEAEREARQVLEDMPEHAEQQAIWVKTISLRIVENKQVPSS